MESPRPRPARGPTRRRVLQGALALPAALAMEGLRPSPLERLRLGIVGVSGRGAANLQAVAHEEIAALCDVDARLLEAAAGSFPGARTFRDFRDMIASVELDGVVVSTPDHTHFPAAQTALEAGLPVYCEKPLTRDLRECRTLQELAAARGVATQMGTQIHASENYRRVVEQVRSGLLGRIRRASAWVGKAWGGGERPPETPPVPEWMAWDLWLGPAPERPYHSVYHTGGQWRRFWDFGGGTLADMGCHLLDLVFWALELRYPSGAEAENPKPHPETAPTAMHCRWDFPGPGGTALEVHWYDGGLRPPALKEVPELPEWGMGVLFEGEEGYLLADYGRWIGLPAERFRDAGEPAERIPPSPGHHREWLDAIRGGPAPLCRFGYAGPLTETVLLGNVAWRAGGAVAWDGPGLRITGGPEGARELVARPPREGW